MLFSFLVNRFNGVVAREEAAVLVLVVGLGESFSRNGFGFFCTNLIVGQFIDVEILSWWRRPAGRDGAQRQEPTEGRRSQARNAELRD